MGTTAVQEACKDEGLATGEQLRQQLDGPQQDELFEHMADRMGRTVGGERVPTWNGKGRKRGSKNVATKQMVDFIRAMGVDPLMFWARNLDISYPEFVQNFIEMRQALKEELPDADIPTSVPSMMQFLEHQRKCSDSLARVFYPNTALADAMKEIADAMPVIGFAAMARMRPGEGGAAKPSISHEDDRDDGPAPRVPTTHEENQEVSGDGA